MQAKALEEDPTVFDYDGVYDSMQEGRAQPRQQEKLQRKVCTKTLAHILFDQSINLA